MPFEFDAVKDTINRRKHGLPLAIGIELFDGDYIEQVDTRYAYGEARFVAVGPILTMDDKLHSVTYTWRGANRRLISVRRASAREIRIYRDRHA